MKKFIFKFLKNLIFILFFFIFIFSQENGFSEDLQTSSKYEVKRILIFPFEIYADKEFSYLKEAIPEMLASRLFSSVNAEIVELEKVQEKIKNISKINKEKALEIGKFFKADYVILGSITILGETVSLDAQIFDISEKKKPVHFFQEIKGVSELIPQLTRFVFKTKVYIEGSEEDFYKAEPFYGQIGYSISREHPERGYMYYFPYLYPPRPQEDRPKVTRAKGFYDVEVEESLTKGLVIDVTRGTIGWAEEEQEKQRNEKKQTSRDNATLPQYGYYPPQPYYPYSPPPYYYYHEEEGILSKILSQFPFFKERKKNNPQFYQPQVIPVPQLPPQPSSGASGSSSPQVLEKPKNQDLKSPSTSLKEIKTIESKSRENPWSWE